MADRVAYLSGYTPYAKDHHSSREQHSLQNERLPERRRKQAEDMTTKCIGLDSAKFAKRYLGLSPDHPSIHTKPVFDTNPFAELKDANNLGESEVQAKFVSAHLVSLSLVADRCATRST